MSQQIFSDIDPEVTTGLMLSALLDDFKDALMSGLSGTSRPAALTAGGIWIDTSQENAPTYKWSMKLYTGVADREILSIDVLTGSSGFNRADDSFTVRRTADDAVGAILNLMKARIEDGGQVKEDDLVGRFQFKGHTIGDADVVTAYMQAVTEEDMTNSERGVIFSFYATPEGTNSVIEHLRYISGITESVVSHKFNALILGRDSVAGSASMVVTDDKLMTEITGGSGESIHGVEAEDGGTKFKVIVNSGSVDLTVKHQSNVASAEERFKLPDDSDIVIPPEGSATFYYCVADSRWKYVSGAVQGLKRDLFEVCGGYTEWVAPFTGYVNVVAYPHQVERSEGAAQASAFGMSDLDRPLAWGDNQYGQLGDNTTTPRSIPVVVGGGIRFADVRIGENSSYGRELTGGYRAWGRNQHGQLGDGSVTNRSSPVSVGSGRDFRRVEIKESSYGTMGDGTLYAWGVNTNGQLGVGDVTPRSSPVAVLGGLKFSELFTGAQGENRVFAVNKTTGSLYAWGANADGALGVGDVTPRSSPVAVLGGLKFTKVALGANSTVGLTSEGGLYGWGNNDHGQLGVGDVVPRSSPVAVLGGLTFSNVVAIDDNSYMAVTVDGTAYAWGENDVGQLGDNSTVSKSSPVAVVGGLKFGKIAVLPVNGSVIAIDRGGVAYAWGKNTDGELGNGDTSHRSSPTAVLGSHRFSDIKMGASFAYGFADDGRIYAWGDNTFGQLGDNSTTKKSSPVLVVGSGLINPADPPTINSFLPVVKGETYVIRLGGGVAKFGDRRIGTNIGRVTIAYYN